MRIKNQKGQAAILIIFVLGMIALLIGLSLMKTGFAESIMGRTTAASSQAFYAANTGVEDALYKVGQPTYSFGSETDPDEYVINLSDSKVDVKVWGSTEEVTIESTGTYKNFVRKIKVVAQNTSTKPGFGNAIFADKGGVELEGNTHIGVLAGFEGDGNVWSNSFINGKSKRDTGTGISEVGGSAFAVDKIDCLAGGDANCGIYVGKDAWGAHLNACNVQDTKYSENTPADSCDGVFDWVNEDVMLPLVEKDLPDMGIEKLKANLEARGLTVGSCELSKDNPDCGGGIYKLGNMIINGDLTINTPEGTVMRITGPLWVKGNLIINSNTSVGLDEEITEISQIVVVDGVIESNSEVTFGYNQDPVDPNKVAFLLFLSTKESPIGETDICEPNEWKHGVLEKVNNSISLFSNTNSVLFYATQGCVYVKQNGDFNGAILGKKIKLDQNANVLYDPRLQSAIFGITRTGGWQILKFEEY